MQPKYGIECGDGRRYHVPRRHFRVDRVMLVFERRYMRISTLTRITEVIEGAVLRERRVHIAPDSGQKLAEPLVHSVVVADIHVWRRRFADRSSDIVA